MTTRRTLLAGIGGLLVLALGTSASAAAPEPPLQAGPYTIAGPYVHENLSLFLIHGPDTLKGKSYLTLQDALVKKIVLVHETGDVNELAIENISIDQDVYVQSGDIVKGGRQDRTIAMDFICPPKSGRMPVAAFCVEQGRWNQRGSESDSLFASSENAIAGKDLKLAARKDARQGRVWREVAANQQKLSQNTGVAVASKESQTSLELSLENKSVQQAIDGYVKELQPLIDGKEDVIGYAFAINGKMNSADVYGSHALFNKLWPKLLNSAAVEALAELEKGKTFEAATAPQVAAMLADADKGQASEKDVTPRVHLVTKETKRNVAFECHDRNAPQATVHTNYIAK